MIVGADGRPRLRLLGDVNEGSENPGREGLRSQKETECGERVAPGFQGRHNQSVLRETPTHGRSAWTTMCGSSPPFKRRTCVIANPASCTVRAVSRFQWQFPNRRVVKGTSASC